MRLAVGPSGGRVWCGFTCPQTVWTDLFMMVERWIEGDRNVRMRFDKASAKYAEFGPFYVSYLATAEEMLAHCRIS